MRVRPESFGAVVALEEPPALAWVDHAMTRTLGVPVSEGFRADTPWLSAPTEAHVMLTNRCPAGCPGCYTGATPSSADATTDEWTRVFTSLAEMGVFHVALGGGESTLRSDLFELATRARTLGLVPNLTTSGIGMTRELAEACRVFGQVNVSLDGLGDVYTRSRGYDGSSVALRALNRLREAGVEAGVNLVLSKVTLPHLAETVARVDELGGTEVELLRFKPAGRGRDVYEDMRLSPEQADALLETILDLAAQYPETTLKVDCSLVPFLCAAEPPVEVLERFGIFGCEAAHALIAVSHERRLMPCSFLPEAAEPVDALSAWDDHPTLAAYRHHHERAPEPCASCAYRTVCKGGCRAVSLHLTGDAFAPDPECPRVIAHGGIT